MFLLLGASIVSLSWRPQGWSKFYEFSTADLRSGADVIGLSLRGGGTAVQWALLHGLLENAIYGGRVDNSLDSKVNEQGWSGDGWQPTCEAESREHQVI
jgi:hypothetical protein